MNWVIRLIKTNITSVRISNMAREIIDDNDINVSGFLEKQLIEHFSSIAAKKMMIEDYKKKIIELEKSIEAQEKRNYNQIGRWQISIMERAIKARQDDLDKLREEFNQSKLKYGPNKTIIKINSLEQFKELIDVYKKFKKSILEK